METSRIPTFSEHIFEAVGDLETDEKISSKIKESLDRGDLKKLGNYVGYSKMGGRIIILGDKSVLLVNDYSRGKFIGNYSDVLK